jgi:hypothetical protein
MQRKTPAAAAQPEPETKPKKPAKGAKPAKKPTKTAKPASKKGGAKPAADRSNKKAEVIAMMKRAKGVTLAEIVEATGWQRHYADVRIMPTCVGNPVYGAGIAAMESA